MIKARTVEILGHLHNKKENRVWSGKSIMTLRGACEVRPGTLAEMLSEDLIERDTSDDQPYNANRSEYQLKRAEAVVLPPPKRLDLEVSGTLEDFKIHVFDRQTLQRVEFASFSRKPAAPVRGSTPQRPPGPYDVKVRPGVSELREIEVGSTVFREDVSGRGSFVGIDVLHRDESGHLGLSQTLDLSDVATLHAFLGVLLVEG